MCSSKRAELICELTDSPALTQIFVFTRFKPHLVLLLKSLDFTGERSELKSACKEAFSCWLSRVFALFEHLCMFVSHALIKINEVHSVLLDAFPQKHNSQGNGSVNRWRHTSLQFLQQRERCLPQAHTAAQCLHPHNLPAGISNP